MGRSAADPPPPTPPAHPSAPGGRLAHMARQSLPGR